jgi:hypothetical protein
VSHRFTQDAGHQQHIFLAAANADTVMKRVMAWDQVRRSLMGIKSWPGRDFNEIADFG